MQHTLLQHNHGSGRGIGSVTCDAWHAQMRPQAAAQGVAKPSQGLQKLKADLLELEARTPDCPHCPRTSPRKPHRVYESATSHRFSRFTDEFAGLHPVECCRDELGQPTRRVGSEAPGLHGRQRGGQALAAAGAGAALATYTRMPSPRRSLHRLALAAFCRTYPAVASPPDRVARETQQAS